MRRRRAGSFVLLLRRESVFVASLPWVPLALGGSVALARADQPLEPKAEGFSASTPPSSREQHPPPRVALAEAVNLALRRSPTAAIALAEIRRAEALVEETRASSLPSVLASASYTRLNDDRIANGVRLAARDQINANVLLTIPIIAPKAWAQWSQLSDAAHGAKASAADVRRSVALAAARAYLTILAQKRVVDAASRARDTDSAHFAYAHERFIGGVGTRLDEVRANQQLQTDVANVERQWEALSRTRELLGVLIGADGPIDAQETDVRAEVAVSDAMGGAARRSDVVAADAKRRAADHVARDSWTDYAPYLTGLAEPFYNSPGSVTQPPTGWQAQLILTIPLYDGGLRYGQEKERAALRDEATATLDATLRQARSDVRTAFEAVKRADAALASSRQAAGLAESALELSEIAYHGGATSNIEVIDAERTAHISETAVAVAEDTARQARLDLLAATGRFP